jgi:hypothetical protein
VSGVPVEPSQFFDLDFVIKKISWSLYEVESTKIKGTLRLLSIPTNILEIPEDALPPGAKPPVLAVNSQGIVSFINRGKKEASGGPIPPQEFDSIPKEDITSYLTTSDEPFNEYVAKRLGKVPLLVRTKTVLLKALVLKNKYNVFGDPIIYAEHSTSHSVSEYKEGEVLLP